MRWLVLVIGLGVCLPAAAATGWRLVPEQSRLGFAITQQGGRIEGEFHRFRADIRFSPDDLAGSGFDVVVEVSSIDTGSRERDRELPGRIWFDEARYPQARFRSRSVRRISDDRYEAIGELTIRGHTRRIALDFDWRGDGPQAEMQGRVTIDRSEYGVGQGEWADTDVIGRMVTVMVDLTLRQRRGGG